MKGKHIVLGVTGGIAAYKSASLVRLFVKAGAEVQVIMTPNAKEFVAPLTFSTLSGKPVISEFFTANTGQWNSHVDLGLWADAMVIAPATASSIAKMANGVADNMLITSYLSTRAEVFIAPAMDLDMMQHPTTQRNLKLLESYGNHIIEPAEGELASHLVGKGRMEEPENIFATVQAFFHQSKPLAGKRVLVTAGPTREKIDPVRFISNYSTGKMGVAIANAASSMGADVTLVLGPCETTPNRSQMKVIDVESANDMLEACQATFPNSDIAIMTAAVADYAVANPAQKKIKREGNDIPQIEFVKNPDIAAHLGAMKSKEQYLVGFALETDNESFNARGKMERKNLDMIVLNSLKDKGAGFATNTNKITIFDAQGNETSFPLKSKTEVASDILNAIVNSITTSSHE